MTDRDLPRGIEIYDIGARRLYVKTGVRNYAISEDDVTPEELVGIARDIATRQATRSAPQIEMAFLRSRSKDDTEPGDSWPVLGG
jgi:hypothetical protein